MKLKTSHHLILTLSLCAIGGTAVCLAKSPLPENTPAPDLTAIVITDLKDTYHLGPTGARGWIHKISSFATPDDFEGYFTNTDARQILITAVEKGSPADGVLAAGDVILGTGNARFGMDARKAIANAVDDAEKEENKGVLRLLRWRPDTPNKEGATVRSKGTSEWVELRLKVMGTYSDTAPFDCPKSKAIVDQTAALIFSEKRSDRLHIAALGLLATGEERYLAAVRDYIREQGIANPKMILTVATAQGSSAWTWSYAAILLGEYHLLTGDKQVLPALETYAVALAKGVSIAGNWGHKMADYAYNDGKAHGRLTGYGALNQVGLTCFMAMNLAERCGIRHPELTRAIARSGDFFGYFAGKGAIPYGHDHPLEYMVTNNGMSGSAAIAFALQGDKERAGFFSRLSAAAHTKTEVGHTGTFFGTFWTPLGANQAGPDTCAEFFKEHRWIHTLARKWNGGFAYQAPGGRFGGSSESYYGLSSDGAHLIFYATPRRQLVITGRDPDPSIWLKGGKAKAAVAAGALDYPGRSDMELLTLLEHPVPMVRRQAADALGTRKGDFVAPLTTMLANGSRDAKVGAVHGLAALKERAAPAIDSLVAVVANPKEDLWVRNRALLALPAIGKPARKAVNTLLKVSLADKPEDPRGDLDKELALTISKLVEDPYMIALDKDLFYPAVRKFLDHPHHVTRTAAMKLIANIPLEDFHLMADKILRVIRNDDPNYETYHHDAARAAGLAILVRLNIRDGIDLCIETLETDKWGQKWRVTGGTGRLATLVSYGADAKRVLPQLQHLKGPATEGFLKAIGQSTATRKLISLEEAIKIGREPAKPATGQTGTGPTLMPQCAAPFGDHAILQQMVPLPVWGTSLPGARITVTFNGLTKTTAAGKDGTWRVTLDPMPADKLGSVHDAPAGRTLSILSELGGGKATKTFKNILVGEVWLCSGQSNMAGRFGRDPYPRGSLAEADYPALRKLEEDQWTISTPETAGRFSRVSFCFARKLQEEIMVPVGLMIAATGGSPIESWMRTIPQDLQNPQPKRDPGNPRRVTNYESKIAPLVGYGMRGAIWYQGEGNAKDGREYFLKMQSMIGDWRQSWGLGDFPFYYVQIASIGSSPEDNPEGGDGRARIRNAQLEALTINHTGMAVAIDVGSPKEHPLNKYDIGIRLARWALHMDYGRKDLVPSGPIYKSHKIQGSTIRVSFDYAQNGLMLASKASYLAAQPTPGAKMPWLSIQAKDGKWHWAEGRLDGADLLVSSKDVKDPIAVRYAYTQYPVGCNLYNKDGLPASPFSTGGY